MNIKKIFLITLFLIFHSNISYSASLQKFNNEELFIKHTKAIAVGALPTSGNSITTVGSLSFTDGPNIVGSESNGVGNNGTRRLLFADFVTAIDGSELVFSGVESFNVDIEGGAYAFGLTAYEPTATTKINGCNVGTGCTDSTFLLTLFNDTHNLGNISFNLEDDRPNFVGILSDEWFNRAEIREFIGANDNEAFTGFVVGTTPPVVETTPPVVTPIPAGIWLFISGLMILFKMKK